MENADIQIVAAHEEVLDAAKCFASTLIPKHIIFVLTRQSGYCQLCLSS